MEKKKEYTTKDMVAGTERGAIRKRKFHLPTLGVTVEAASLEEALEKAQALQEK